MSLGRRMRCETRPIREGRNLGFPGDNWKEELFT